MPIRLVAGFRTIDVGSMQGTMELSAGGGVRDFRFEGNYMVPFGADVFVSGTFDFSGACDRLRDFLIDEHPTRSWDVYYDNEINRCIISASSLTKYTFNRSAQRVFGFDASYNNVKIVTGSRAPFYIWSSTYDERSNDTEVFEPESKMVERVADSGRAYSIGRHTVLKERRWVFQNEPRSNVYTKYSSSLEPYTWERFIKNLRRSPTPFVLIPSYVTKSRLDFDDREAVYEMKEGAMAFKPTVQVQDYHDFVHIPVNTRVYKERNNNPTVTPFAFPIDFNRVFYGPPVLENNYGFSFGDVLDVDLSVSFAWNDVITPVVESIFTEEAEREEALTTFQYNVFASSRPAFGIADLVQRIGPGSAPSTTASINTRVEQNEFYVKVDTVNSLGVTRTPEYIYFRTPLVLNLSNHSASLNGSGSNAIAHYRGDQFVNLNTKNFLTGWGDITSNTNDLFVTGATSDLKITTDSLLNNKPAIYFPGDEGRHLALENGSIAGASATVVTGGLTLLAVVSNPQNDFHDSGTLGIFGVKDIAGDNQEMMINFVSGTGQISLSRKANSSSLREIVSTWQLTTSSWILADWNFETNKARLWVNNDLVDMVVDPTGTISSLDFDNLGIQMGVYNTTSSSAPRFRCAEAVIWEGFPDSGVRDNINDYVDIRYDDATGDGLEVQYSPTTIPGAITGSGGTISSITISGSNYTLHKFTGTDTFGATSNNTEGTIEYFVVAAGGGGGDNSTGGSGGGGAGGVLTGSFNISASETFNIEVGQGVVSGSGGDSGLTGTTFNITASGGGVGGNPLLPGTGGGSGGGGGGGGSTASGSNSGGAGIPGQGTNGGSGESQDLTVRRVGGGGGGAGTAGDLGLVPQGFGGNGGDGIWSAFDATGSYYAGGGGGHGGSVEGLGGLGGGGVGSCFSSGSDGADGTDGLGGGGGGSHNGSSVITRGGHGTIMVRYFSDITFVNVNSTGSIDTFFLSGDAFDSGGEAPAPGPADSNLYATGGDTIITQSISGSEYIIHTFTTTGSGSFQVLNTGSFTTGSVEYLVVGGGAGVGAGAGGGGAGGLLTGSATVASTSYNVVVGAGGAGKTGEVQGDDGHDSYFGAFATSFGGGAGGQYADAARPGGSGGGGAHGTAGQAGGTGSIGQGNDGGTGTFQAAAGRDGGGGGAGAVGDNAGTGADQTGGDGGDGLWIDINGTGSFYAGGGGGWSRNSTPGAGGQGGGGDGKGGTSNLTGDSGVANTGGGGGAGAGSGGTGGDGGSGIVIIRYLVTGALS